MSRSLRVHTATLALALFTGIAGSATLAKAGTDTGTLAVSVVVQDVCSVDGGMLDFGTYSGGQASAVDAAGSIRYLGCGTGALTFSLDGGASGTETARTMQSATGASLGYQLYRNTARTLPWGTGANAMTLQLLVAGSGDIPIYGRIPGGQEVAAGSYSDAINVTLTF